MIPRVLRNFRLFVNGIPYNGRVTECELPDLSVKTEEHRGGGMDGMVEIDMGMEAMSAKFTFAEYIADVMKSFGRMDGNAVRVQVRGALQRDGEAAVPYVVELIGGFKKSTRGTWKAGDMATHEVEMSVRYLKETLGSDEIVEVDVDNMIRKIGGIDELASIRAAMGD